MVLQNVLERIRTIPVTNGAHVVDGQEDEFSAFLSSQLIPAEVLHHLACDSVERLLLWARENDEEPPHVHWELLLVKRLWLAREATVDMLVDARIALKVDSWKRRRRKKAQMNPVQEKREEALSLLLEGEATWMVTVLQAAAEAAAWSHCAQTIDNPLQWLGALEDKMLALWIEGWNEERAWQSAHLMELLQAPRGGFSDAKSSAGEG